jgi:hypothetical protein
VISAFDLWLGQHVVMQLALGDEHLSVRGMLLKTAAECLLVRLEYGPEIHIPKAWVLAIEEGRCSSPSHRPALLHGYS